ncbi:glyoxalase-like domain protein [Richelia intracellularis]|uniref:glyoxalase-like domain protein n=1 Tax=Richelia intracellularis TaxID=1164990 RepID=UPI0005C4D69C|nr:glyoxalase-like domain protein [Richelia intracellularis]
MVIATSFTSLLLQFLTIGSFFPFDSLFSTQGIMVMLLAAYAGAMWMFLTSAPKVYTLMVSDLEVARHLYEIILDLPKAEVPLHYYYNYEQTIGATGLDPLYLASNPSFSSSNTSIATAGLWYQLKKNTQLHIITGASLGKRNNQRHVCFDHDCLELILMRVEVRGLKFKIRSKKPLNFLVKDYDGMVVEMAEINN